MNAQAGSHLAQEQKMLSSLALTRVTVKIPEAAKNGLAQ